MESLSQIHRHNQIDVLKKLDFRDFVEFKKCSKGTVELTKNFRHLLAYKIRNLCFNGISLVNPYRSIGIECILDEPIRIEVEFFSLNETLTPEHFSILEDICKKRRMVVDEICWEKSNEQEMIDNLIKLLNPVGLSVHREISQFSSLKELHRLKKIKIASTEIKDFDWLLLKNPEIVILRANVKGTAVNTCLKQWMAKEREIEHLSLPASEHWETFQGLNCTAKTRIRKEIFFGGPGGMIMRVVYALKRSDGKKLCIGIRESYSCHFIALEYSATVLQSNVGAGENEDIEEIEEYLKKSGLLFEDCQPTALSHRAPRHLSRLRPTSQAESTGTRSHIGGSRPSPPPSSGS